MLPGKPPKVLKPVDPGQRFVLKKTDLKIVKTK